VSEELAVGSAAPNIAQFRTAEEREKDAQLRALSTALVNRYQFARQAGITFGGKRDLYEVLGYSRELTSQDYIERYARGGLAKKLIECLPKATWRGGVELVEDEDPKTFTEFEKACTSLNTRLNVHAYIERADILSQLSWFSVLVIGAPGFLHEELPKGNGKPDDISYIQPYAGAGGPGIGVGGFNNRNAASAFVTFGEATVVSFDDDDKSKRFGQPLSYQLRRSTVASALTSEVHWSRVIHLAEGCLDNDTYGVPSLQCVWNLLDDLDKVRGGGSEAYWIKANAGLHADVDKTMGMAAPPGMPNVPGLSPAERERLREQLEEYQHQINRVIVTRGVNLSELGGSPADFSAEADAIITQIAGTKGIPKRILTGSEMGELASSQDRENFRDIINGRQTGYVTPYVMRRFYDRLIEYNYLPKPKQYEVRWAHIQTLTEQEKADGAQKWASVNSTQGEVVFTKDEIREKWYQLEPLTEEEGDESLSKLDKARGAMIWAGVNKSQGEVVFSSDEIRQTWEDLAPLPAAERKPMPGTQKELPGETDSTDALTAKKKPQKLLTAGEGGSVAARALDAAIAQGSDMLQEDELRAAMDSGDQERIQGTLQEANDLVLLTMQNYLAEPEFLALAGNPYHDELGRFTGSGKTASEISGKTPELDKAPLKTFKAYHVTRKENAEKILKEGFNLGLVKPRWNNDYAVSLSSGKKAAMDYFSKRDPKTGKALPFDSDKYTLLEVSGKGRLFKGGGFDTPQIQASDPKTYNQRMIASGYDGHDLHGIVYVHNTKAIKSIRAVRTRE
jgi:hypothetical protein